MMQHHRTLPLFPLQEPDVAISKRGFRRKGQAFTCDHCCEAFYRYPSDIRKAAANGAATRFCSKRCEFAHRRNDVTLTCPECQTTFTAWASVVARAEREGRRTYCSAACRDAANARELMAPVLVNCDTCGAPIRRTHATAKARNYCSMRCKGAQVHTWTKHGGGRSGVRPDLGHFVRSTWEANICRVLRALGVSYEYEPETFRCGDITYTPDLLIGSTYIEVKGYMSPRAERKLAAFRAHYPEHALTIIDRPVYRAIEHEWAERIPAWER